MPIVAFAFHGTTAIPKLKAYYESPHETVSETRTIYCPKCDHTFAAVLVDGSSPMKELHIEELKAVIGDDCINGLHQEKYTLDQPD